MRRRIIFDPEARLEFEAAVAWYNERKPGLGDRFEAEVHTTLQRVLKSPEQFQLIGRTIHRVRVGVFDRYSLYYRIQADFIGIVSVFHASRSPAELKRRLE